MLHKNAIAGDIHAAHNWEFVNKTTREAATGFVTSDLKKLALQLDDFSLWVLTAVTPTWVRVGGATGSATGGAGAAKTFFLTEDASFADNFVLSTAPSGTVEVVDTAVCNSVVNGGVAFIDRYVSDILGGQFIEGGRWVFNTYASVSSNTGLSEILTRINKRVAQTGVTVAFTGTGATRTLTATGGAPFLQEHAAQSILTAALVETPTQTGWISGYVSPTEVVITLTDPAFVNVAGVPLSALYTLLFSVSSGELTGGVATLYSYSTVQPAFAIGPTDRIVAAYFGRTDSSTNKTVSLYHNGTQHYSNIETPLVSRHNSVAGLNEGDYIHLSLAEYTALMALLP